MYKVFFKDRTVYFGDDFSKAFEKNKGLFYRYNNIQELNELVEVFFALKQISNLYIFHEDMLSLIEEFKSCFRFVEAGGGLVFDSEGRFLVIKRNGIWDLPKGKLEPGEDFASAALRETGEETGLEGIEIGQPIISTYHTYQQEGERFLKKTRWFEMVYKGKASPVLQSKEGITESVWVKPGQTDFIRKNTFMSILDVLYIKELL
ncbi:MAG: NUDIX domain-containing protein [Bacteroidales bacterium]